MDPITKALLLVPFFSFYASMTLTFFKQISYNIMQMILSCYHAYIKSDIQTPKPLHLKQPRSRIIPCSFAHDHDTYTEWFYIRKTCPCNVYPLKPHFYIVKLGFVGVYLFFLFLLQNIDRRGGSNVYPQSMF